MALFPDWFGAPQPDWPAAARSMDFAYYDANPGNGTPSPAQAFLDTAEPFIVFARGSVASDSDVFFERSMEACRRLKMRALLLGGEKPASLPAQAAWFPTARFPAAWFQYVPLGQALKRATAIVHHGGIGTVSLSLAAGVPQIAVPFGHDQFDNAQRLERLGVSKTIARHRYTLDTAGDALREILDSRNFTAQARSLAARCSPEDSLERVCDVIEAAPSVTSDRLTLGASGNAVRGGR
jgi:rhamnosyltransferase subunit B